MPSNDGAAPNDIPPHLYEIACNMAELSPDRQAALMAAMTEEERMLVQRAMDEAAIARSQLEAEFRYTPERGICICTSLDMRQAQSLLRARGAARLRSP